ncbi:hypothetical protein ES705_13546 [subsurface metagenome]
MSPNKIECMRCKKRKDPRFFVSPWLAIRYWIEAHTYLTPPNEHKPSQPVVLCRTCLRTLAVKAHKRRHNQKPKYRLSDNIRAGIRLSFKTGRGGLWEHRVGYTIAELRQHLERLFEPGMSWQNRSQWHIHHIRPVSSFHFSSYQDEDFKRCWALPNLQPLWACENYTKKKYLTREDYLCHLHPKP